MRLTTHKFTYLLILMLCLTPALGVAGGHGGGGGEGEGEGAAFPGYIPLQPPLVVNLDSARRAQFLRVDLQFFVETAEDASALTLHMPLLRDRLITLLGGRKSDTLMSMEAREALRGEVLEKVRTTMTEQSGKPAVTAVYFTGFIIQ